MRKEPIDIKRTYLSSISIPLSKKPYFFLFYSVSKSRLQKDHLFVSLVLSVCQSLPSYHATTRCNFDCRQPKPPPVCANSEI
ncbi:hypothetical protein L1887_28691 [Cichorium endivia]|nr:hypothetical protein L1887_28691 [Cichorium endivia]